MFHNVIYKRISRFEETTLDQLLNTAIMFELHINKPSFFEEYYAHGRYSVGLLLWHVQVRRVFKQF